MKSWEENFSLLDLGEPRSVFWIKCEEKMALLQIDGCLTVIGQILNNLSDSDLLNLREASPKLENLFSRLQPAYWRKRLYKSYRYVLVDRFLKHTG